MNRIKNRYVSVIILLGFLINACTYDKILSPSVCENLPEIELVSSEDTDCGFAKGSIEVQVIGGDGSHVFTIADGQENTTGVFENLSAGSYTIIATASDGCSSSFEVEVNNKDGINIVVQSVNTACGSNNGEITIQAEGGLAPYQFDIDGIGLQSDSKFEGLTPGTYEVTGKDANGCEVTKSVKITSDATFESVTSIITANCAVSNCHDGTTSPDFRNTENIKSRASRIESRTGAKTMPPGGRSITQEQIDEIACWVGDGSPS